MDNKIVGEFIATRRKEKGLTQRELAEKLHVTNKAISKWENGLLMLMYGIKRWKQGEKYGLLVVIGIVGIVAPFLPSIVLLLCLFFLE